MVLGELFLAVETKSIHLALGHLLPCLAFEACAHQRCTLCQSWWCGDRCFVPEDGVRGIATTAAGSGIVMGWTREAHGPWPWLLTMSKSRKRSKAHTRPKRC